MNTFIFLSVIIILEKFMFSDRLEQRLKLIKKSAIMTRDLSPEQMLMRGFELISFAKNAPLRIKMLEDNN